MTTIADAVAAIWFHTSPAYTTQQLADWAGIDVWELREAIGRYCSHRRFAA